MLSKQNKLKGIMREYGLTQQYVADYLDLRVTTLNRKLNGKFDFTKSEIDKILILFGKTYEEIFFTDKVHN